jgi:hypothetical protein
MTYIYQVDWSDSRVIFSQDGAVIREGLVFRCGEYPDKGFSLTTEEADRAIANFKPVFADYEHRPGPLDKKLGLMTKMWRNGTELWGQVQLPSWLDSALKDAGRKVSLAWHPHEKNVVGWGWVTDPRIPDAAFAAFMKEGNHEMLTDDKDKDTRNILQQLLDEMKKFTAGPQPQNVIAQSVQPTTLLQPATTGIQQLEGVVTSIQGMVPQSQFTAAEKKLLEVQARVAKSEAIEFTNQAIAIDHTMLAAERDAAVALFALLSLEDETNPQTVTFGKEEVTRVALFKKMVECRKAISGLMKERVPSALLFSQVEDPNGPQNEDDGEADLAAIRKDTLDWMETIQPATTTTRK